MIQSQENLILIVDDEIPICRAIARYLKKKDFVTEAVHNGLDALDAFRKRKPVMVLLDIQMPDMSGIDFLKEIRKFDTITPVIIMTGHPDVNTAIKAIQYGANDYVTKPFQIEVLFSKINQVINNTRLVKENTILTGLVSLHEIANKLANTHKISELLDISFQSSLQIINADNASIQLVINELDRLIIKRKKGKMPGPEVTTLSKDSEWSISKWVIKNACSLLITDGLTNVETDIPSSQIPSGSMIYVPLKTAEDIIGVMHLSFNDPKANFSDVECNMMEVLASQTGSALGNANLYKSLNDKISELSLICNYSEHFVGLVELSDVIKCLIETVQKYFSIDVIGFLIVKKRFHEFLYWTRGMLPNDWVDKITKETIQVFNTKTDSKIMSKRVKPHFLEGIESTDRAVEIPLEYSHIIPLVWEGINFGALYFGAEKVPDDKVERIGLLKSLVNQTRIALVSAKLYSQMKENYIRTIKALAIAVDAKDNYTHGHSENVMNIAESIAREIPCDDKEVETIRDGGLLHDIGKIGIPGYILNKPGPLTSEEFNGVMKTHSTLGANIVRDVPFLQELHSLILHHHERHDGKGYPDGLKGDDIPLGARVLHVADAFEAMTSNRPYRDSLGKREAINRLMKSSGTEFDPDVVEAFVRMAKKKGWFDEED